MILKLENLLIQIGNPETKKGLLNKILKKLIKNTK